jgi:hypothetical protein
MNNLQNELSSRERYFDIFASVALFAFGAYQSILYFGHKIVPISDFPTIVKVAQELLSFKVPSNFKMAPVVGLLQAGLSYFVDGQTPDLTAGWLLNAILHPFTILLLWLVGKRILGRSAVWFALVAAINPWLLYMLREPLVETPLLFFVLLTTYLILRRSKWCYLAASVTTMVRYEGAALILAAFVMDMIESKNRKERMRAFLFSVLATMPLLVWLGGTVLNWKSGTSHYFNVLFTKEYAKGFETGQKRTGLIMHMQLLWEVAFRPLLLPYPGSGEDFGQMVFKLSKLTTFVGFFFGSIYGLVKKRWEILVLLLFFVPYFILHAFYPYPLQRYHSTIFWIAILIAIFGFQSIWHIIDGHGRVPKRIIFALQLMIILGACGWISKLVIFLPKLAQISPRSASLPYVAFGLAAALCVDMIWVYRNIWKEITLLSAVTLVIASNQVFLAGFLGDGKSDEEFKLLGQWYSKNTQPGEKLGVYMFDVVRMFVPKDAAQNIVPLPKADDPAAFVKACQKEGITYVVWASREGLSKDHYGYHQLGLDKNIAFLREPKSIGPYEFIAQIKAPHGYVNIFRLNLNRAGKN